MELLRGRALRWAQVLNLHPNLLFADFISKFKSTFDNVPTWMVELKDSFPCVKVRGLWQTTVHNVGYWPRKYGGKNDPYREQFFHGLSDDEKRISCQGIACL